jgi:hypothetical protein
MKNKQIYKFLIKNFFKLKPFMNIKLFPFTKNKTLWEISYKNYHGAITGEQKYLSDVLWEMIRDMEDC